MQEKQCIKLYNLKTDYEDMAASLLTVHLNLGSLVLLPSRAVPMQLYQLNWGTAHNSFRLPELRTHSHLSHLHHSNLVLTSPVPSSASRIYRSAQQLPLRPPSFLARAYRQRKRGGMRTRSALG